MAYYLCPHCAKAKHETVVHKDGTVHHTLVCRENGQEAYIGYRWEGCPYKRKEE